MKLTVKLFAAAREAARADEVALEVPGDATTARHVLAVLATRADGLAAVALRSRLAVNRSFAAPDAPITPEDEVALIPPVGGG